MRPRTILLVTLLALFAAVSLAETDIPRRPDGKPDLSGTYDIASLTPMQRDPALGERKFMTLDEATEIARMKEEYYARDNAPSDPDRGAPEQGGTQIYDPRLTGAAGGTGGYNAFWLDPGNAAFQIDGKYRTSILVDPPDGRMPPLTEAGKARRAEARPYAFKNTGTAWWLDEANGPYDNPESIDLGERCLITRGATIPATPSLYNNYKRLVQTDDTLMINIEWMHDTRMVHIGAEHDPSLPPKWNGHSVGRWEGDTLVVDTRNFISKRGNVFVRSEGLRIVERFSRLDEDTLLYNFTVHDPEYTAPYTGEMPWPESQARLYEYACHEGNYSMGGILRGARLLEEEELARRAGASSR
jgi:hypothetical protein